MADPKKVPQDTTKKHPNPAKLHKISGGNNDGGEFDPSAAGNDSEFEPAAGGSADDESEDLLM